MKNIKEKLKLYAGWMVATFTSLLLVGGSVAAYQSYNTPKVVVEGNYIEAAQTVDSVVEEPSLGAAVSWDQKPRMECTSDGACTYVVVQTFQDATTTLVSLVSPFRKATSTGDTVSKVVFTDEGGKKYTVVTTTVDLVRLNQTGAATSSFRLACGATSTPVAFENGIGSLFVRSIVSTTPVEAGDSIPTSTVGIYENGLTVVGGAAYAVGNTTKITLDSANPYLLCVGDAVNDTAFTNGDNTFAGKATVRMYSTR